MPGNAQPLVSVRIITYNHAKFIKQCIEGALMQKTTFPFEILIGEDCSTDGTREIVFSYAERYPDLIRVITSDQNVGANPNIQRVIAACRGKYYTICEGDDYWIDPLKLQKQFDFMEANPDCPMCFHNAFIISEDASQPPEYFCPGGLKNWLSFPDVIERERIIPTLSVFLRADIAQTLPQWRFKYWCGDLVVRLWCAHCGQIGYLNEIMGVYRKHAGGITQAMAFTKHALQSRQDLYAELDRDTDYVYSDLIKAEIRRQKEEHTLLTGIHRFGKLYYLMNPAAAYRKMFKR